MPFSSNNWESSSTRFASPTDTTSGWWRSICPISSSRFAPAASATTPKRPVSDSTTERHWRPIEPVEPKMESCFTGCFEFLYTNWRVVPGLGPGRVDQDPIIPDNGNRQDKCVDPVKNAAMAREQTAGIFDPGAALVTGLQQISHLPCDVSQRSHRQQMTQRHVYPRRKQRRDK